MPIVLMALACAATGVMADVPSILGRSFVVRDRSAGSDGTRRHVTVTAREKASPTPLLGDPTAVGAAIDVGTIPGPSQILDLPASGWRTVNDGFRYDDRDGTFGAVVRVVIRRDTRGTFTIKATLSGAHAQLDLVPPNPGAEGEFAIVFHDGPIYCVHFGGVGGGDVRNDDARLFKVSHPTALGPCPANVLPTSPPTTSSTSTTSSTTSSTSPSSTTIVGPPCGAINGAPFCWGECPAETPICADILGSCQCVSGTQPCDGIHGSTCDGACPAGEACVSGGLDCACMPLASSPCYTGAPGGGPTCGGFCPSEETCVFFTFPSGTSGCVCAPPTCFGPSSCTDSCPPGRGCQAADIGEGLISCLCLP